MFQWVSKLAELKDIQIISWWIRSPAWFLKTTRTHGPWPNEALKLSAVGQRTRLGNTSLSESYISFLPVHSFGLDEWGVKFLTTHEQLSKFIFLRLSKSCLPVPRDCPNGKPFADQHLIGHMQKSGAACFSQLYHSISQRLYIYISLLNMQCQQQ